VISVEFHQHL